MRELLLEFLSTFTFYKMSRIDYNREDTNVFRLGGLLQSMSISDFEVHCGFYDKEFLETERYQTSTLSSLRPNHSLNNYGNTLCHTLMRRITPKLLRAQKLKILL